MKATNQNQRAMRKLANRHDTGFDQAARDVREENIRRANAATAKLADGPDRSWLMRDVCSTPYATIRS